MRPLARWRTLESALTPPSSSPSPLLSSRTLRSFSVCAQCLSKIGQAPLSIPPGVTFDVLPPVDKSASVAALQSTIAEPTTRQWHRIRRGLVPKPPKSQLSTVHVKGPLGEMHMAIPPYVSFTRQGEDGKTGAVVINVQDSEIRKQREMWGAY
jgi:large subunit ribosomal protein L6